MADAPEDDKYQYTYFTHKLNSFDTAPKKLLPSDSRLRPDRYALEKGDLSKAGSEKSRSLSLSLTHTRARIHTHRHTHARTKFIFIKRKVSNMAKLIPFSHLI